MDEKAARRRRSRWLLAGATALFACVLAEVVYRAAFPVARAAAVTPTANQYEFYQYDPTLGWANTPEARGSFQRAEFSYEVAINEHGMRQRPIARSKAAGTRRIAVLGDSFVWGIGVSDEERLTEQLEQRLEGVEVLNFGVSGYASVQYALLLDEVLSFEPELVVVVVCLANDFADNVLFERYGYFKPYAELRDGELVIEGAPVPNVRKFGFERRATWLGSRLLGDLRDRFVADGGSQRGLVGFDPELVYADPAALSVDERGLREEAIAVQGALLADLRARLADSGIRLLVVPAPTKREYNQSYENEPEGVFLAAQDVLQDLCARLGIDFIPTVAELSLADFWLKDGHWRPSGHARIARLIAAWVEAGRDG